MHSRSSTALVAGAAAVLATLSGCALVTPASTPAPRSPTAQCVIGPTWNLDTADLGVSLLAQLQADRPEVTAIEVTGTKTITWDQTSFATIDSDLTIIATTSTGLVLTQRQTGTAEGKAYIDTEVAIPRRWTNEIEVTTTAEQDGAVVDPIPYNLPPTAFDDTVGWELTCDASTSTMTLHPRGDSIVQKWTTG